MKPRIRAALAMAGVWFLLVPARAEAQDGAPLPPLPSPSLSPSPPAQPPAPPPLAVPTSPPPAAEPPADVVHAHPDDDRTDPERVIGHLGVTYFDITDLPIANSVAGGGVPSPLTSSTVAAPVVGVRYWLSKRIGIDGGLGIGVAGGSDQTVTGGQSITISKTSTTGFALHAGLPIALAEGRHYAFLVIPETTIGFTMATFRPAAAPGATAIFDQDLSGFLFTLGARVGAEIYFGFIGVPQLALQASVGLSFRRSVYKWSSNGSSSSDGTNTFGTNVNADPWAIFKDAVSATYYF
jgi:hypothetical protein